MQVQAGHVQRELTLLFLQSGISCMGRRGCENGEVMGRTDQGRLSPTAALGLVRWTRVPLLGW